MLLNFLGAYKSLLLVVTPPADPNKLATQYGRDLIAKYEGLGPRGVIVVNGVQRVFPYICPAGKPTLGRGLVISWDEYHRLKDVGITLVEANANFKRDVDRFSREVAKLIKVGVTDYQFDAVVSLAYNIGIANLKSSTLLRKLNLREYTEVANEFPKWVYANKKKLQGLVNRREAEKRMYLNTPPRPVNTGKVESILKHIDYMTLLVKDYGSVGEQAS